MILPPRSATGPRSHLAGSVAADGEGANGLYTEELLQALRVPGLKVEEVFKRVRVGVTGRSKGAQTPWESSSLTGDLVVNVTVNVTAAAASGSTGAPASTTDRAELFWISIKDGTDPAAFEAYLKQYPEGTFAQLARQRLFDGTWAVTMDCPAHGRAAGYIMKFSGQVKDRVLLAQHGIEGHPNSLTLRATIQPDGSASIDARGITGDPRYTVNNETKGTPYAYRAIARFEGSRGTGSKTDIRPCNLTFARQ